MGRSHAVSGMLAWITSGAIAPILGIHPSIPDLALGALACAGAALLPDLDLPGSSAAGVFGRASDRLAGLIHRAAGGHRHATHSLLIAAATTGVTALATFLGGTWIAAPLLFVLAAMTFRAWHTAPALGVFTAAMLATAVAITTHLGVTQLGWMPAAVGIGYLTHLAGDCLTAHGCPLLWHPPRPRKARITKLRKDFRSYTLPLITHTGNEIERYLVLPLMCAAGIALLVTTGR